MVVSVDNLSKTLNDLDYYRKENSRLNQLLLEANERKSINKINEDKQNIDDDNDSVIIK